MRRLWFPMVALFVGLFACAKTGEETLNYARQISGLQHYNETLERYLKSFDTDPEGRGEVTEIKSQLSIKT